MKYLCNLIFSACKNKNKIPFNKKTLGRNNNVYFLIMLENYDL